MHYRQTFLRHHIERQLARRDSLEILAVEELLRQVDLYGVEQNRPDIHRNHPQVLEAINYRQFFYRNDPDEVLLYIPLRLKVFPRPNNRLHPTDTWVFQQQERTLVQQWKTYREEQENAQREQRLPRLPVPEAKVHHGLSELLRSMSESWRANQTADPRGVLLQSRSGAGKTAACWKAFYDCLFSTPTNTVQPAGPPLLAGHLPCWLPLDLSPEPIGKSRDILRRLLSAAGLPDNREMLKKLERWLACGPPLLIFADLNAARADLQMPLAKAFVDFQARWGEYGHRLVVTFRSTLRDAGPLQELQSGPFGDYDLLPLEPGEAVYYLDSLRRFEQELQQQTLAALRVHFHDRDPQSEQKLFAQLATQFSGGSTRAESVISTPVLMHFFSVLPRDALHPQATLPELYDAVARAQIERDFSLYRNELPALGLSGADEDTIGLILVALTRLALAMQAQGQDVTRLAGDQFTALLTSPTVDGKTRKRPQWWPGDSFWHSSPIFKEKFGDSGNGVSPQGVLRFSLLRRSVEDGHNRTDVAFLHDSFLYHFCGGVALTEYGLPGELREIDSAWWARVSQRISARPELWVYPAPFLAGRVDQLDRANRAAGTGSPVPDLHQLLALLVRQGNSRDWLDLLQRYCQGVPRDTVLQAVEWGLRAQPGFLQQLPQEIPAEVHRHLSLLNAHAPFLKLLEQLHQTSSDGGGVG